MGLEWREVDILARKATTPSKVFLHLKAHTLIAVHSIILNNSVNIYLLCMLKINHMK
jgi:hypothetical protein